MNVNQQRREEDEDFDVDEALASIAARDVALWRVLWSFYKRQQQNVLEVASIKRDLRIGMGALVIISAAQSPLISALLKTLAPTFFAGAH